MEPHQFEACLHRARSEAIRHRNYYVTREHLLFALLEESEIREAFRDLNIPMRFVSDQLGHYFEDILEHAAEDVPEEELGITTESLNRFKTAVILQALGSSRAFPRFIDFVIAMSGESDTFAGALFRAMNVKPVQMMRWAADHFAEPGRAPMDGALGSLLSALETPDDEDGRDDEDIELEEGEGDEDGTTYGDREDFSYSRIKTYVTRLVEKARQGHIDPVVGRDREIDTCCRALLRRSKCNVLIVGEAGVGKTAIVEGLARKIALGEVPSPLRNAELYAVDVPGLMAGTKFRGEMEGRIKAIVGFVKKTPDAILFIDELHTAASLDRSSGTQDILSLLKPELAMGTLRLIGTTTYEDFRRCIANDTALLRRFHKLDVEEPDEDMARSILKEIQKHYAEFHHVSYTDAAIEAAVSLSGRYMPERRFPDKAIDIIDEAGAENRMRPENAQHKIIDVADIERIVTENARIPELHVSKDESALLATARDVLKQRVFGQDKAIDTLVDLVKLSRAGIRAPHKPVACLLFAGPTGVGKTEVARQLADALNLAFLRFDMSEYREEYTVSKFIGSAPGYVGFDRGGLLTEAVRAKPCCVLLLDEIEKAHHAIFDLLLQVMDVARLTDNTGKTADFRHVILIMTSNSGGEDMNRARIGFDNAIDVSMGLQEIEKTFSPEFRNRLDDIVLFNALSPDCMIQIASRMVDELARQVAERHVSLDLCEDARRWLAEHGYAPKFGARPMARLIQREIALPLADEMLFGPLKNGGTARVRVNTDGSGLSIDCLA